MINLLPPESKKQIKSGRFNIVMLRYVIALAAAVIFLAAFTILVCFLIMNIKASAEEAINQNNQRTSDYSSIQAEAAELRSNLATAKTILDKEISYSNAILIIAQTVPSNVVIDSISLDASTFGAPTTISAHARSNQDAVALRNAFQDASAYFSDVSFQTLSSDSSDSQYPVSVTLSLIISRQATVVQ